VSAKLNNTSWVPGLYSISNSKLISGLSVWIFVVQKLFCSLTNTIKKDSKSSFGVSETLVFLIKFILLTSGFVDLMRTPILTIFGSGTTLISLHQLFYNLCQYS
jgi:hypothetical protein